MQYCPIRTVFCAEDTCHLLGLSNSDAIQLHKLGVLQFSGRVDTIAGCRLVLPNSYDLLEAKLYLSLISMKMSSDDARELSISSTDLFANILDTEDESNWADSINSNFDTTFLSGLLNEYVESSPIAHLLLETALQFWNRIFFHIQAQSKNKITELESFNAFSKAQN